MRTAIAATALGACVGLWAGAASAASISIQTPSTETRAPGLELVQWGGGYCARLRRACQFKEERGEVGEGNCRRYRAECGGGLSYCERLRRACYNKDVRGEVGQGNCRRYRAECGR